MPAPVATRFPVLAPDDFALTDMISSALVALRWCEQIASCCSCSRWKLLHRIYPALWETVRHKPRAPILTWCWYLWITPKNGGTLLWQPISLTVSTQALRCACVRSIPLAVTWPLDIEQNEPARIYNATPAETVAMILRALSPSLQTRGLVKGVSRCTPVRSRLSRPHFLAFVWLNSTWSFSIRAWWHSAFWAFASRSRKRAQRFAEVRNLSIAFCSPRFFCLYSAPLHKESWCMLQSA